MAKALFLTYNSIGKAGTYQNGTIEETGHQAVIVQHPKGETWGAIGRGNEEQAGSKCQTLVHSLYAPAVRQFDVDLVVIYVGDTGSEGAIDLAASIGPEKVRLVLCDCNASEKRRRITARGLGSAPLTWCECGGHATMERVLREFLATGSVELKAPSPRPEVQPYPSGPWDNNIIGVLFKY